MFKEAYTAAVRYYKAGPWYHNADIWSGLPTQQQTTSLQAFWPGTPCASHAQPRERGRVKRLPHPEVRRSSELRSCSSPYSAGNATCRLGQQVESLLYVGLQCGNCQDWKDTSIQCRHACAGREPQACTGGAAAPLDL